MIGGVDVSFDVGKFRVFDERGVRHDDVALCVPKRIQINMRLHGALMQCTMLSFNIGVSA